MKYTTPTQSKVMVEAAPSSTQNVNTNLISKLIFCTAFFGSLNISAISAEELNETDVLETITVTAEKRNDNILEIASNISARSAAYLQDAEISDVTELSQHVPNLQIFSWGGRRDTNVFIRGIGPGLFTDPTVGFYVDGINYSNNGSFDMDLMDIQRIEILKGPQGTLYGGNSLAGVISIVTRPPSDITEGRASLTLDDLSRRKLTGSFSTPLHDSLYFKTSVSIRNDDGYINNIFDDTDFGQRDDISARTKLRWLPNDDLEASLTVDYEKFRGDSYAMGLYDAVIANPQQIDHDFIGKDDRDTLGAGLTLNWQGESVDFTSITSLRNWDNFNSADQDAGSVPGYIYHSSSDETHKQLSQELRWTNKSSGPWDWIFGLYAYTADLDVSSVNTQDYSAFGMGSLSVTSSESTREDSGYAAFGQLYYDFTDQLTLTVGLRLDHEEREAFVDTNTNSNDASTKLQGKRDFDEILPKIALSYAPQKNSLIYTSISKGYRAGGFDTLYPNLANPTYDSEASINYELGYKSRLLDDSLDISGAVFLVDLKDQQIQQLLSSTGTIVTDNAGKSSSKGIEFETSYIPQDGWLISFAGNYTDVQFEEYIGVSFATFAIEDYAGNMLPNAPKWSANFSVQNRRSVGSEGSLTWFSRLDSQFIDSYFFDPQNLLEQNAYNLLNLKTGIESDNWEAYIWVKNALNEYYSKVEFDFGVGRTTESAPPRSIGITVNYSF